MVVCNSFNHDTEKGKTSNLLQFDAKIITKMKSRYLKYYVCQIGGLTSGMRQNYILETFLGTNSSEVEM